MRIITTLLLCCCTQLAANAKENWYLGAHVGYGITTIASKEDKSSSSWLKYVQTYKPNAGIALGYAFKQPLGLHTIELGFDYVTIGQKYVGSSKSRVSDLSAQTNLTYLRIPVKLSFSLPRILNMTPLVTVGGYYGYLLDAKDEMTAKSYLSQVNDVNYRVHNKSYYNEFTAQYKVEGTMTDPYFNKNDIGVLLGIGLEKRFSKHFVMNAGINISYGLTNNENESSSLHTTQRNRYFNPSFFIVRAQRPPSHNIMYTFNVGVSYFPFHRHKEE
ncbi:MAG: hypothetical protein BGO70_09705 [Bacteroidetes bacterium 43-93]|nr:outer membrane beta-barrel protein [Bacteroidota bacterium]OJX00433.1 MAG: hypothetical protein BGO70_09705 [Bacteroidetes bacterium 43-93]